MLRDTDTVPPLHQTLGGRHLLVTGTTGFLGKVWLSLVLTHLPEIQRLTLLIRPGQDQTALQRFLQSVEISPAFRPLRAQHGQDLGAFLASRIEVLEGDITKPGCGLDEDTRARIATQVDLIVHCAGLTVFEPDPLRAVNCNIIGTRHIADIASSLATPRMVYVSTCYVAGFRDGEITEEVSTGHTPLDSPFVPSEALAYLERSLANANDRTDRIERGTRVANQFGWPNMYTFSKAIAEQELLERNDLDAVIARPSVIESAMDFPLQGWNEGLNTSGPLIWYTRSAFPTLPARPDCNFDVIPVDAVARWLTVIAAATLRGDAAPIYHLATSDVNPFTVGRCIDINNLATRRDFKRPGATPVQRLLLRHLDISAAPGDEPGFFSGSTLLTIGTTLRSALHKIDLRGIDDTTSGLGTILQNGVDGVTTRLDDANRFLKRVDKMLEMYRPFIHDTHWVFHTGSIRRDVARLDDVDRAFFGWNATDLNWRHYWMDIHYPGILRWSLPLLYGHTVPEDVPFDSPLTLDVAPMVDRTACK